MMRTAGCTLVFMLMMAGHICAHRELLASTRTSLKGKTILIQENYPNGIPPKQTLVVRTRQNEFVHIWPRNNKARFPGVTTGMRVNLKGWWLSRGQQGAAAASAAAHGGGDGGGVLDTELRVAAGLPHPKSTFCFWGGKIKITRRKKAKSTVRRATLQSSGAAAAAAGDAGVAYSSNPLVTSADMSTLFVPIAAKQPDGSACPGTSLPRSTPAQVKRTVFAELNRKGPTVGATFAQCSYGKSALTAKNSRVAEVVDLPCSGETNGVSWTFSKCDFDDFNGWADAADQKLAAAGVDLSKYLHKVYLLPPGGCPFVGLAYVGCDGSFDCRAWVNGDYWRTPQVIAHEIGHHLFLAHSGVTNSEGGFDEYGDTTGLMGACCNTRCPTTPQAWQLGWAQMRQLDGTNLKPGTTATVLLASQSNPSPSLAAPRGVRILPEWATGVDPIYAGFRARTGGDVQLDPSRSGRISIYTAPAKDTYDAQPTLWKAALAVNQSWEMPEAGIVIRYRGAQRGMPLVSVCRKGGRETLASCTQKRDVDCNGLVGAADPACAKILAAIRRTRQLRDGGSDAKGTSSSISPRLSNCRWHCTG